MITCQQLIAFLDAYVDGSLEDSEQQSFEEHLAVCPACVDYIASYRATIDLSRRALSEHAEAEAPPDVPPELISAILASARASRG